MAQLNIKPLSKPLPYEGRDFDSPSLPKKGVGGLAVSNVFGSNITNLAILGFYDLVYLPGSLWSNISQIHIFTSIVGMIMTSVAITGLIYHTVSRSRMYITWDGLALIILYISGMYVIYRNLF
ncbi:hypothetical protein [Anabaena sphaerica]|uniref:hypothetical protein n=1 Tax=Anabaena sphaerica TaxID=212446 RepID=UPI0030CFB9EF